MGLQISFNASDLSADEARGLMMLLREVHGDDTACPRDHTPNVTTLEALEASARGDVERVVFDPANPAGPFVREQPPFPPPLAVVATPPAASSDGAPFAPPTEPVVAPAVADGRDADGLPWDARIHASTKVLNADGTWRGRRGVHDETRKLVEAELRQNMAAPAPPPPPPLETQADVTTERVDMPPPPPPGFQQSVAPDVPPPPPAPPTASGPQLFADFMRKVTEAQTAGTLTTDAPMTIAKGLGLASTAGLMTRPDLLPAAEAQIDALIAAAG